MEPIIHIHAEFRVTLILSTVLSVGLDAMFTIRGIVVLICFALAGNTLAGAPGEIRAAESAPPTTVRAHLDISAAESCATSTSVAARVAKRSSRIEFAGGGQEDLPVLRGKIGRTAGAGAGVQVELVVVPTSGARRHPAADRARLRTRRGCGPTRESGSNKVVKADPSNDEPARLSVKAEAVHRSIVMSGSFGLSGAIMIGPAPRAMAGLGLFGFVAFDRASPLSLALRATAAYYGRGDISETGGVADFSLGVVGLDVCGLRLTAGPVSSRACAAGRVGRLAASGSNTYDPQSNGRFFASIGSSVLGTLTLPSACELAAEAEVGWALTRSEFAFDPNVFCQTSPLVFTFGVGIGRRF